jgi:hypothetical protein
MPPRNVIFLCAGKIFHGTQSTVPSIPLLTHSLKRQIPYTAIFAQSSLYGSPWLRTRTDEAEGSQMSQLSQQPNWLSNIQPVSIKVVLMSWSDHLLPSPLFMETICI